MQILKEGDRVKAIRQFKAPYNNNIIQEGDEGVVYAIGLAWDEEISVPHVGVNTNSGMEVSIPLIRSHLYWRPL